MKRLLLIVALLLAGCKSSPEVAVEVPPLPGESVYNLDAVWQDQDGGEFRLEDLRGRVQLVAMVYASCKGACPRIIADMKALESMLPFEDVGLVLISIDPEVDTPERLRQLAQDNELGERWRLLRGDPDQVLELAAVLGVKYRKVSDTDYAHSNIITVLDPDGLLVHQQEGLGVDPDKSVQAVSELLGEPAPCCSD